MAMECPLMGRVNPQNARQKTLSAVGCGCPTDVLEVGRMGSSSRSARTKYGFLWCRASSPGPNLLSRDE